MALYVYLTLILILVLSDALVDALLQPTDTPPLLDVPTYSLATHDGKTTNMNIVTYATPVSIRPDRIWSIGLFKGTVSHENFSRNGSGVLQLLREPHAPLVKVLGGCSGRDVNKEQECAKLGFPWTIKEEKPFLLLPKCASYLKLTLQGDLVDCGSHDVAICRVDSMMVDPDATDKDGSSTYLSTARLRDMGIITEQGRVAE